MQDVLSLVDHYEQQKYAGAGGQEDCQDPPCRRFQQLQSLFRQLEPLNQKHNVSVRFHDDDRRYPSPAIHVQANGHDILEVFLPYDLDGEPLFHMGGCGHHHYKAAGEVEALEMVARHVAGVHRLTNC